MLQLVLEQCRSNGMVHDNVHKHRTDKNHNDPSGFNFLITAIFRQS